MRFRLLFFFGRQKNPNCWTNNYSSSAKLWKIVISEVSTRFFFLWLNLVTYFYHKHILSKFDHLIKFDHTIIKENILIEFQKDWPTCWPLECKESFPLKWSKDLVFDLNMTHIHIWAIYYLDKHFQIDWVKLWPPER